MTCKEFTQAVKRLCREGLVVAVEPGRKHWHLTLACGLLYHAASTPSDRRAIDNMVASIKRYNRLTSFKPGATVEAHQRNGALTCRTK